MIEAPDTHPHESVALCVAQVELWRSRYEEASARTPRTQRNVVWTEICRRRLETWNRRLRWEADARLEAEEEQQLG
jgi:hypothetical protein